MYSVESLEPIIESLLTIVFFISGLVSLRARSTRALALPWMNSALTISPRREGSDSEPYMDTSAAPPCSPPIDRKSTRLNSSHLVISYAVFCLKKKNKRLNSSHLVISYSVFCLNNTHHDFSILTWSMYMTPYYR